MTSKVIQAGDEKTYVLVFETGEEVVTGLLRFAKEEKLSGAHLTAIGAFERVTLGFFEVAKKDYTTIPIPEQDGGHLADALVRPTLEVVIIESSRQLRRRMRPELGAALLDLP